MRITGGKARGIRLKTPPRKNAQTRPATDRLRESLFSSLGDQIIGSHCLDLFAGTGSYGLEALSRGALFCGFIESDRTALSCLKANQSLVLKSAQLEPKSVLTAKLDLLKGKCVQQGLYKELAALKVDYIFLDPPYALWNSDGAYLIDRLALGLSQERSILIAEVPSEYKAQSKNWSCIKEIGRKPEQKTSTMGKPSLCLFQRISESIH